MTRDVTFIFRRPSSQNEHSFLLLSAPEDHHGSSSGFRELIRLLFADVLDVDSEAEVMDTDDPEAGLFLAGFHLATLTNEDGGHGFAP
jgi:hypothetical protein